MLAVTEITAVLSGLAAVFAATTAYLSYKLARKIQRELKSDERIIVGRPQHPELKNMEHSLSVIVCPLFNKSKRKAYIESVLAFDQEGQEIPISWSSEIDGCGNPRSPLGLIGVVDSAELCVRRSVDGERISFMRLRIRDSFDNSPIDVVFDPLSESADPNWKYIL